MTATATAIAALTAKGHDAMLAIGRLEVTFFDDGATEGSGSWGSILTDELGHKSSGVLNRLRDLGLMVNHGGQDGDEGDWWCLTALGADVAQTLAGGGVYGVEPTAPAPAPFGISHVTKVQQPTNPDKAFGHTAATARTRTLVRDEQGNVVAKVQAGADLEAVIAALQALQAQQG